MHVRCWICDQKQCGDVNVQRVLFTSAAQTCVHRLCGAGRVFCSFPATITSRLPTIICNDSHHITKFNRLNVERYKSDSEISKDKEPSALYRLTLCAEMTCSTTIHQQFGSRRRRQRLMTTSRHDAEQPQKLTACIFRARNNVVCKLKS